MTNKTITDKYLKANGLTRRHGRTDTMAALIPFCMMDACYQMYHKHIFPLKCKNRMKQLKGMLSRKFKMFQADFLSVFNSEEQDFIYAKMDTFEDFIQNDVVRLRMSIVRELREQGFPEEKLEVLSSTLVCNTIAQAAQVMWGHTYIDRYGKSETNRAIEGIEVVTMEFLDAYHRDEKHLNLNECEDTVTCMNLLCKSMVAWLSDDVHNSEES